MRNLIIIAALVPTLALGTVVTASFKPSGHFIDTSDSFAILRNADDQGELGTLICKEMAGRGIDVDLISSSDEKNEAQLVIRYEAVWNLITVTWHPIAIGISVFDANGDSLLAGEVTYTDALAVQSSDKMIADLSDRLFGSADHRDDHSEAACEKEHKR